MLSTQPEPAGRQVAERLDTYVCCLCYKKYKEEVYLCWSNE